ncbi:hypothetical protein SDC9_104911 [bioreactor metagenome]|uniref:Uncharacterized protein n=1 Tax=bioreactor metagenome TaxID=1076179 RepID=A0A645AXT9_9ZZZZ
MYLQRQLQLFGFPAHDLERGDVFHERQEFIAAGAPAYVSRAEGFSDGAAGGVQRLVSRLVADGVVDLLKTVKVDGEQRLYRVAALILKGFGNMLHRRRVIQEPRQRVGLRGAQQRFFLLPLFVDILHIDE